MTYSEAEVTAGFTAAGSMVDLLVLEGEQLGMLELGKFLWKLWIEPANLPDPPPHTVASATFIKCAAMMAAQRVGLSQEKATIDKIMGIAWYAVLLIRTNPAMRALVSMERQKNAARHQYKWNYLCLLIV